MDTAVAVIPKSRSHELAAFLTKKLPEQSEPWVVILNGEAAIFVHVVPAEDADLEDSDLQELKARLQSEELTALLVEVAVRNVGCAEVRELVAAVVEHFSGVASDDVSERWWTAEEIRTPGEFNLQPFWPHETRLPLGGSPVDA